MGVSKQFEQRNTRKQKHEINLQETIYIRKNLLAIENFLPRNPNFVVKV